MGEAIKTILSDYQDLGKDQSTFENEELHEYKPYIKFIHKFIVKPISYLGSSKILRKKLLSAVGDTQGKTIIDVSCGDDEIIFSLARNAKKVTASDISATAMAPLVEKAKHINNLKFQINNLIDLKGSYDIVVCKNTLHHMNTVKQVEKALRVLKGLGTKIIIMDIQNPKIGFLSRLWNLYYRIALKDQGSFFMDYNQFIQVIRVVFLTNKIEFKRVNTIKGTYMLAIID